MVSSSVLKTAVVASSSLTQALAVASTSVDAIDTTEFSVVSSTTAGIEEVNLDAATQCPYACFKHVYELGTDECRPKTLRCMCMTAEAHEMFASCVAKWCWDKAKEAGDLAQQKCDEELSKPQLTLSPQYENYDGLDLDGDNKHNDVSVDFELVGREMTYAPATPVKMAGAAGTRVAGAAMAVGAIAALMVVII